jgi:hypothetical protein
MSILDHLVSESHTSFLRQNDQTEAVPVPVTGSAMSSQAQVAAATLRPFAIAY